MFIFSRCLVAVSQKYVWGKGFEFLEGFIWNFFQNVHLLH